MALLPDGRALVGWFMGRIYIVDTKGKAPWAKQIWGSLDKLSPEGIDVSGERGLVVRVVGPFEAQTACIHSPFKNCGSEGKRVGKGARVAH